MSNFLYSNGLGNKLGIVLQMCFIKFKMISRWPRARDSMWGHKRNVLSLTQRSLVQSKACQLCTAERMKEGRGHSELTLKMWEKRCRLDRGPEKKGGEGNEGEKGGQKQRAFNCLEWAWQLRGEWREKKSPAVLISPALPFQSPPAPSCVPPSTQFTPVI